MNNYSLPLFLVAPMALFLPACHKAAAPSQEVVFAAIQKNVQAMESKDPDVFMATIHPSAPSFDTTRAVVEQMFQSVDVKSTVSDLQVISATPEEVKVSFIQKTEKTGGKGEFINNIVEGVHTLRPDQGKWKIYSTVQTNVTGLDGKPIMVPDSTTPAAPEPSPAPTPQKPAP